MRGLDIAIFIFMINLCVGLVGNTIFPLMTDINYVGSTTSQSINNTGKNTSTVNYIIGTGDYNDEKNNAESFIGQQKNLNMNPVTGFFTLMWGALTFIVKIFYDSVVIYWLLVEKFGIPYPVAGVLQAITTLSYMVGLAQFFSGRSTNQME